MRAVFRTSGRALLVFAIVACLSPRLRAQAVSGPRALDACGVVSAAELEQALGTRFKNEKVTGRPRPGVSTCAWVAASSRSHMSISVTTYAPEAIKGTNQRTLRDYYDSLKANSTRAAGHPAQVFPRIAKHASYLPNVSAGSDAVLVFRADCIVTLGVAGANREQAVKLAEAAAQ